jgi:hypothetical protein
MITNSYDKRIIGAIFYDLSNSLPDFREVEK